MKSTNLPSQKTAVAYSYHKLCEFIDSENESTSVYEITRQEWEKIRR